MNNADIKLYIVKQDTPGATGSTFIPKVLEGITWTTERYGTAGKLEFFILNEGDIFPVEGDKVEFHYNGTPVFLGFIFTIQRDKTDIIKITAYDQLRYLKNKGIHEYKNKRADEVVKMLADDYRLQLGELDNTGHIIPIRKEVNKTLLDIINTALSITLQNTKKIYVLYDNFGKIMLKDIESLYIELLIDENNSENFSYTSSIDRRTYNRIVVYRENEKAGTRELYITESTKNHNEWGILQHVEQCGEKENPKVMADALLELYNKKTRMLSIKNVLGDVRCRAGFSLFVKLDTGDIDINNKMIINRVTHTFKYQEHLMTLDLIGGVLNV
ncbi:hydrolase [Fusobacterium varium]|uniref:XkdQ/YqbQ family protein n=1 Tax=Fusobacterium sp. HMSC073F01 TaxID=1739251 RepID=UPI0009F377A7|nr:hydrolase [Fusobacterium sp. HMSC073F01]